MVVGPVTQGYPGNGCRVPGVAVFTHLPRRPLSRPSGCGCLVALLLALFVLAALVLLRWLLPPRGP
jgi:hypothetical protein